VAYEEEYSDSTGFYPINVDTKVNFTKVIWDLERYELIGFHLLIK
jgi:hypothetical protein